MGEGIHTLSVVVINLHNNNIRHKIKLIIYIKNNIYIKIDVGWLLYFWWYKTSKIRPSYTLQ